MHFPRLEDIQRRRKILGMTQSQLSKRIGISQSLLTKIERGLVVPNYKTATELFDFLENAENSEQKLAKDAMHTHVLTLKPSDTVQKAVGLVKRHSISQFPVLEGHKPVGSIASVDLIGRQKSSKIAEMLAEPFPSVNEGTPLSVVKSILRSSRAVVVLHKGEVRGIITAEDLL
ncbi:MAG: CBS domain-containing protein [Candidatus Micrarchaeota archaeon]|nr:CBS domain-containing protein [Candidatus Micrarchaeota archaeon]